LDSGAEGYTSTEAELAGSVVIETSDGACFADDRRTLTVDIRARLGE
jgi:hypothetical protein